MKNRYKWKYNIIHIYVIFVEISIYYKTFYNITMKKLLHFFTSWIWNLIRLWIFPKVLIKIRILLKVRIRIQTDVQCGSATLVYTKRSIICTIRARLIIWAIRALTVHEISNKKSINSQWRRTRELYGWIFYNVQNAFCLKNIFKVNIYVFKYSFGWFQ